MVQACLWDPDINEVYRAFAEHWGFTPLPTQPRHPEENGKQERSGQYVKDNALKGRRFDTLEEQNEFLRRWNRTIARLRIHGTTRRQVWTHFLETDKPALQPLAASRFELFTCGDRTVHADAHVQVEGAFYPLSVHLIGQRVRVRFNDHLVHIYHHEALVGVFPRQPAGTWAPQPGSSTPQEAPYAQRAFVAKLLGRCERAGPALHTWAQAALEERGVRAIRLIQGVLSLARSHPRERLLHAAAVALERRCFRYQAVKRLTEEAAAAATQPRLLIEDHPSIRPMTQYRLEAIVDDPS